jgi:hypothetical protein
MDKAFRVTVTTAAIGLAALSLSAPAHAGNGSAVGAGLVGFGIGAILGSMMGPPEVYFVPPPPDYYGPPVVYGPPNYDGPVVYGPIPRTPRSYSERTYPRSKTPKASTVHRQGPAPTRSATAKTAAPTGAVEQKAEVTFKAAQAKAKLSGVHTLTQKDIAGLSREQIKQLRGY